ncbi:uncharacterized protein LOC136050931 [Cyrtonyx montezumae]|uniref:uncharacterized protein LOC136050931 n=1 Tax=Cyrtonyx montezumae TaxID=9017 RepID=UPI0032DBA971
MAPRSPQPRPPPGPALRLRRPERRHRRGGAEAGTALNSLTATASRHGDRSRGVRGAEKCMKPQWDPKIRFIPDQKFYDINTSVMLMCPNGYWSSATEITCVKTSPCHGLKVPHIIWYMKNSTGFWQSAAEYMGCVETCQRPRWGAGLRLVPDLEVYRKNEEVMLSCPEGFQPSYTHVRCLREEQTIRHGKHEHRKLWLGRDSSGAWTHIRSSVTCVEVFQVDPGTLEVSSTSIKLNWTCSFPEACQHMQATCRLAGPSSPPCKVEKITEQEILHGQKGTFTCPPLQPFTVYSITISVPPSTILFTQHLRTKAMVPQKPEQLQLDTSTGTLRWKALPSCRGEIIGYQLNFTARRAHDGTFLNFQQVTVNHSVTQYTPPPQSPGSKYLVTVQGLTAAGAGDASSLEFQAYISVIVWFVLSRRKKTVPIKAEEDHYTELQPYENSDIYCEIKGRSLSEEEAGTGGQDREPATLPLPVLESSGD